MDKRDNITYCLYARKSSESDERQAMSIDGQLKEMALLARKQRLQVIETITESHSAKQSGQRPEFNRLLDEVNKGKYNGILTWAPDRLSRNAGDLGRIVDLMDQGKLLTIKTYSQSFSNNPNEKFLLMILCSQAKLENDNRGINVKRGLRAKCQMGWRPGVAPIGYLNIMKENRISTVELDPERAPVIRQMFLKVANQGYSGRMIKRWLDGLDFRTKNGCKLALSRIYATLKNPFYYGWFRFGDKSYKGRYEHLVSKQIFEKVQIQLTVIPRAWNKQLFPFKKICICGSCGGSVTAEIKYKHLKDHTVNSHIYYHCNRIKKYDCDEPYIREEDLIRQLIIYLPKLKLRTTFLMQEFHNEMKRFQYLKETVLKRKVVKVAVTPHNTASELEVPTDINEDNYSEEQNSMLQEYLLHVLQYGTPEERIRILGGITSRFKLTERRLELL